MGRADDERDREYESEAKRLGIPLDAYMQKRFQQRLRYSYSQSRMDPPLWLVKDGKRHIAEVWKEDDAKTIVAALSEAASTA